MRRQTADAPLLPPMLISNTDTYFGPPVVSLPPQSNLLCLLRSTASLFLLLLLCFLISGIVAISHCFPSVLLYHIAGPQVPSFRLTAPHQLVAGHTRHRDAVTALAVLRRPWGLAGRGPPKDDDDDDDDPLTQLIQSIDPQQDPSSPSEPSAPNSDRHRPNARNPIPNMRHMAVPAPTKPLHPKAMDPNLPPQPAVDTQQSPGVTPQDFTDTDYPSWSQYLAEARGSHDPETDGWATDDGASSQRGHRPLKPEGWAAPQQPKPAKSTTQFAWEDENPVFTNPYTAASGPKWRPVVEDQGKVNGQNPSKEGPDLSAFQGPQTMDGGSWVGPTVAVAGAAAVVSIAAAAAAATASAPSDAQAADVKKKTLLLEEVPTIITDKAIRDHWRELGPTAIVQLHWKMVPGSFLRSCSIQFRSVEEAVAACSYAPFRTPKATCRHRLEVGDISDSTFRLARTVVHTNCPAVIMGTPLKAHYRSLGHDAIVHTDWARDIAGSFKGFGFVEFKTMELAKAALSHPPLLIEGQPIITFSCNMGGKTPISMPHAYERARRLLDLHFSQTSQQPWHSTPMPHMSEGVPFRKSFTERLHPKEDRPELEVRRFYQENVIRAPTVPLQPILHLSEVDFGPVINQWLATQFEAPSAIQSVAWPSILMGYDTVSLAQTGSGKTLAFALPALVHVEAQKRVAEGQGPICVILSPTQELAMQTYETISQFEIALGIQVAVICGGFESGDNRLIQGAKLWTGCEIVVATPGQLTYFVKAGLCPLNQVTMLILDEADHLLNEQSVTTVMSLVAQMRLDRQTLLFSATWLEEVPAHAQGLMTRPVKLVVDRAEEGTTPKGIAQRFVFPMGDRLDREDLLLDVVRDLQAKNPDCCKLLIFVKSKSYANAMANGLRQHFSEVHLIHSDMTQAFRETALQALRQGRHAIVVATDVAARGLSLPDLTCVINFHMPTEFSQYIHRIGRCGGLGREGLAVSFIVDDDKPLFRDLIRVLKETNQPIPHKLTEGIPRSAARIQEELANPRSRRARLRAAGFTDEEIAKGVRIVPPHMKEKWGGIDIENWQPPQKKKWKR